MDSSGLSIRIKAWNARLIVTVLGADSLCVSDRVLRRASLNKRPYYPPLTIALVIKLIIPTFFVSIVSRLLCFPNHSNNLASYPLTHTHLYQRNYLLVLHNPTHSGLIRPTKTLVSHWHSSTSHSDIQNTYIY